MSVKILAIGDPHFKIGNTHDTDLAQTKIIQLLIQYKPDAVVVLGDILDRYESIHVNPLCRAIEFLRSIQENVSRLYVLIGNHDRPNNSIFLTNEHPFTSLEKWSRTTVVDMVKGDIINGQRFIFVPYVPTGRFNDALNTIGNPNIESKCDTTDNEVKQKEITTELLKDVTAIFAHQEFHGAKMNAITSNNGDKWPLNAPLVISGHIHDYDDLQENLIYTGSLLQNSFGDTSKKTISFFTFSDGKLLSHERISLNIPKKIQLYLSPQELSKYQLGENEQVKIVVAGNPAEIKEVMKISHVRALIKNGVKITARDTSLLNKEDVKELNSARVNISFRQRLEDTIRAQNSEIRGLFTELFGTRVFSPKIRIKKINQPQTV